METSGGLIERLDRDKLGFYFFLICSVLYAVWIFTLSSSSSPPGSATGKSITTYFDMIAHIILYFGFSFFVYMTLNIYPEEVKINIYILTFLIVVLYGLSDELHQYFVPYRFFSLKDVFFDALGSTILLVFMSIWERYKEKILGMFA